MLHALLCLLPALALALTLLVRRYPGERTLIALRGAKPRPRRAQRGFSTVGYRSAVLAAAHGGLLIARSLAVRPPPALAPASN
ncbi:MAG: hypothetical protein WB709_09655 [Solirubrobacteraceae bacterium]